MRLFIMLLAAVFGLFSAAYQPAETPQIEAPIITQQEQIAPSEAPTIEPITHPTPPQESDEPPAIVEAASAGTAQAAGMVIADEPESEPTVSVPAPVAVIVEPIVIETTPVIVEHAKTSAPERRTFLRSWSTPRPAVRIPSHPCRPPRSPKRPQNRPI